MSAGRRPLSYKAAGVDIEAGEALVERIRRASERTRRPGVLGGLGGFGALFELPAGYREPVLVAGADGVGTKLRLAMDMGRHAGIGIDLVAMCANDVAVSGAEPLFFLDYYATGSLDVETAAAVVAGIAEGCARAGCALVGGETAEMPGMYSGSDYDLAGFCVGVAEKSQLIDGGQVAPGDALLGLASSGPHANGYSLIREVLRVSGASLDDALGSGSVGEALLEPARIYVKPLLALRRAVPVKALAHITGGGLPGNLPRVLPPGCHARIDGGSWRWPAIFSWLAERGGLGRREMYRTFNCGVGMVACVAAGDADAALRALAGQGETAWRLGRVAGGGGEVRIAP